MSKQSREQGRTQRAAAVRAAQARKERNRRLAIVAGVVVLLGAIIAGGAWWGAGSDSPSTSLGATPVAAGDASLLMGDADAPVKVVIYEDFLCPYCRELEGSTREFLQENAAAGKVQVEFRPFNLLTGFPYSGKVLNAWAAVLQHAGPEEALELHDILFDEQPYEQTSSEVSDETIAGWVEQAGADTDAVREAMKTRDAAFFEASTRAAMDAGIEGTPTVFIDGEQLGASSVPDMVAAIERAVAG